MTSIAKTRGDRKSSLEKALELLGLLGESVARSKGNGVRLSELARISNLNQSTAHRLLSQLKDNGFVVQNEDTSRYHLGPKIIVLSSQFVGDTDLRMLTLPFLRKLAAETGVTSHLAVRDGLHGVYIEKVESNLPIRLASAVGQSLNLHSSSLGKVLLAYADSGFVQGCLTRELERRTKMTITDPEEVRHELDVVRRQGFALDDEENEIGIRCIAAPVLDRMGHIEAAIGVAGTVAQIPIDKVEALSALVKGAANQVSSRLGWLGVG